ncbi:hypothetical protein MASR2M50_37870 [Thauera sp.]
MKKQTRNLVIALVAALGIGAALPDVAEAQSVRSIRGADVADPELAVGNYKLIPDQAPLPRDYVQQPPLVPHKVEGYEVSINFNKCMDCHSWTRYRETGATKVSVTHFKDRDGGRAVEHLAAPLLLPAVPCAADRCPTVGRKPVPARPGPALRTSERGMK